MTLYLSDETETTWLAQVDSGVLFYLEKEKMEDYANSHDIERIHYLDTGIIDC